MDAGCRVPTREDVMEGVSEMIDEVHVEEPSRTAPSS